MLPDSRKFFSDETAYVLPMIVFMVFTVFGATYREYYPICYVAKSILVAMLLIWLWKRFTKISWAYWQWGIFVGVLGIIQWVGMEKLLMRVDCLWWTRMIRDIHKEAFNPFEHFKDQPNMAYAFIGIRLVGASLLVPIMEERFWRDFLWRTLASPNDFKLQQIGEYDKTAFFVIPLIFATVHAQWLTAIVWALMIAFLLVKTRSLGACIIAHGVTNLLLGIYVLYTHEWFFW